MGKKAVPGTADFARGDRLGSLVGSSLIDRLVGRPRGGTELDTWISALAILRCYLTVNMLCLYPGVT